MLPSKQTRTDVLARNAAASLLFLSLVLLGVSQSLAAQRTLKVKLSYTGSGTVDEKYRIFVFLFDSPDFLQGAAMPIAFASATSKDQTVTFDSVEQSPVYVTASYDKTGTYDGQSGPPPAGSPTGMYSKTSGTPEPVEIPERKTVEIELAFDDSFTMP
jgi:hypothetical protein